MSQVQRLEICKIRLVLDVFIDWCTSPAPNSNVTRFKFRFNVSIFNLQYRRNYIPGSILNDLIRTVLLRSVMCSKHFVCVAMLQLLLLMTFAIMILCVLPNIKVLLQLAPSTLLIPKAKHFGLRRCPCVPVPTILLMSVMCSKYIVCAAMLQLSLLMTFKTMKLCVLRGLPPTTQLLPL